MSLTTTPGTTITDDTEITPAVLNLLGNPAITTSSGTVTATDVLNYFRNPDFSKYTINTLGGVVNTAKSYLGRHWWMQTDTGVLTASFQDATETAADNPADGQGAYSLKLAYNSGTPTAVDLGQFIPQHLAQELATSNFTVAFYCYNNTGASVTPSLRVSTADGTDSSGAVTFDTAFGMTAVPTGAWTLCKATVDGTALGANAANGLELLVRLPSTLNAAGEEWWFQKAQLVTGLAANTSPPRQLLNPSIPFLKFYESKAQANPAGASSAGTWANQRAISSQGDVASGLPGNWGSYGKINGTSDGVLLAPGVYLVRASAPFLAASQVQSRLRITVAGIEQVVGYPSWAPASEQGVATVEGMILVDAVDEEVLLEQEVSVAKTSDGLGAASSLGSSEYYAEITFIRLSDPV